MSPYEFDKIKEEFNKAISMFEWSWKEVKRHHERDYERSWREDILIDKNNNFLINQSDLSYGLAKEIIRIAGTK